MNLSFLLAVAALSSTHSRVRYSSTTSFVVWFTLLNRVEREDLFPTLGRYFYFYFWSRDRGAQLPADERVEDSVLLDP